MIKTDHILIEIAHAKLKCNIRIGIKKIRYTENPWLQIIKNGNKILKAKKITWY